MQRPPTLAETYEQILHEEEPNFLRLYLSPRVAQTCFCLDRYVRTTWPNPQVSDAHSPARVEDCQSFLANSLEEALSGAIKLARYNRPAGDTAATGLIVDPADRLAGFVSVTLANGDEVTFLPGLRVIGKDRLERPSLMLHSEAMATARVSLLVLVAGASPLLDAHAESLRRIVERDQPLVITCVDRASLDALRGDAGGILHEIAPDLVVFDESFVNHAVPFSAFTARRSLFDCWNRAGKATFHSTTFQPNSLSTRHFMNCLATADAHFMGRYMHDLERLLNDVTRRAEAFRRFYNPSLYRLIRATGFASKHIRAAGSFIVVDDRPIFDVVGGVACSIRGHNPATYADEMAAFATRADDAAVEDELRHRLRDLTGLECFLPAVSGATAVENALKIALVVQAPRRHILALKAGFGGKTLFALTGTANSSYKENIDPLYADVHYVDPFTHDAVAQIDALMDAHDFAVVQLELIQSVGGVRRIPDRVLHHLAEGRERRGYLLLVDEVQTGMYRAGPFVLSRAWGCARPFTPRQGNIGHDVSVFADTLLRDDSRPAQAALRASDRFHQGTLHLSSRLRNDPERLASR